MLRQMTGLLVVMVGLAVIYAVLQRISPAIPGQKFYRRGFWTDLSYWLLAPIMNRGFTSAVVVVALIPVALSAGVKMEDLRDGWGPVGRWPLWQQAIAIVVVGDFFGYWIHRYTHRGWWWKVHGVHHSSRELDWLAAARVHPFNDAIGALARVVPLVALGFAPVAVAGAVPFFTLYAITLHANLSWDYGPFRRLIASPRFHRWHHTSAEEGRDKNFAGLFPVWDILFGTFYMPKGEEPVSFGVDEPIPGTLWGQLAWPFRKTAAP